MRSETSTARPAARGTESLGDALAQDADADALQVDETDEAEAGGQPRGVVELRGLPELHGGGGVHQQVETEVFLVHEELEIETIQTGVDVPVDVADVVANPVGTVIRELDADALAGAAALAPDAPAERAPREQRETLELGEEVRREQIRADAPLRPGSALVGLPRPAR